VLIEILKIIDIDLYLFQIYIKRTNIQDVLQISLFFKNNYFCHKNGLLSTQLKAN